MKKAFFVVSFLGVLVFTACKIEETIVGGSGGGTAGGGDCITCAPALDGDPSPFCDATSDNLYQDFLDCACLGACATDCAAADWCDDTQPADAVCDSCLQDLAGCGAQFDDCANDV